tara:strand:- start:111 stop:1166 length:1056 start_codon:yes stop_codon:yes gene_type:complete
MVALALEAVSSFTRDLGGSCTAISLDGDFLVGGSHEGRISCWSPSTGERKWESKIEGPISDISLGEKGLFVSSSSILSCLSKRTGEVLWNADLEGASDYVIQGGGVVWATSSVYEIEVSDYVESSLWAFGLDGKLLSSWSFEERCWFLAPNLEDGVILGLGRPRCGYLKASIEGGLSHISLPHESPITAGVVCNSGVLFGHSNGVIGDLRGSTLANPTGSIRSLEALDDDSWMYGTEEGEVGGDGWKVGLGGPVDVIVQRPGKTSAWAISWNGSSSIYSIEGGLNSLEVVHPRRISSFSRQGGMVVLGDEKGLVYSIKADFLERRLSEGPVEGGEDGRTARMRERLRGLRK